MTLLRAIENRISTTSFNSRDAATLAASAVFQGVGEDVSLYGRVGVAISSSNATDGVLTMEVSQDNVNWGGPNRTWADTRFGAPHMWNIVEKYFRIKYTNGTTEATDLAIQVHYSVNADIDLGHQLNEILTEEVEATIVRPGTSFDLDAARIHIMGQRSFFFFGFNNTVGTSWVDIHPTSGDINWLTTAGKIAVSSSDAADTSAGLGVRSVEVHGLSATGEDQDEVITMNGTTEAESTLDYIRVNKMHSETCGTYGGSHQGDITCRVTSAGAKTGAILSKMVGEEGSVDTSVQYGLGEATNGYWTVPLGKVMYITRLEVIPDVATNKNVTVHLYEREDILNTSAPFSPRRVVWEEDGVETSVAKEFKSHIKIKALTDLWFRAKASATSSIQVTLDFYLVDADTNGA